MFGLKPVRRRPGPAAGAGSAAAWAAAGTGSAAGAGSAAAWAAAGTGSAVGLGPPDFAGHLAGLSLPAMARHAHNARKSTIAGPVTVHD